MKPLLSTALSSLFSSALHFVGCCCLLTLYPTFAARYGDVSDSDSGGLGRLPRRGRIAFSEREGGPLAVDESEKLTAITKPII